MVSDPVADPFQERSSMEVRAPLQLLGARFRFESNSPHLLRLVDHAFAGLPPHRLSAAPARLRVRLLLTSSKPPAHGAGRRARNQPPELRMISGAGFVGGATFPSSLVMVAPQERSALVSVSADMQRFPYHTRYELIEFAVLTLATRAQSLVPLHAACVGRGGRGLLLLGASGSGKSTVALQCLLQGLEFVAEDGVFVEPGSMLATGVANFVHVRPDSLRWVERAADAGMIRKSPVIERRSGVKKFEVDLRRDRYRIASAPLKLAGVVFLSAHRAVRGPLLTTLPKAELQRRLIADQPYAANQPGWAVFQRRISRLDAFELRRGRHPLEAVAALDEALGRAVV
jgi:hypothetical protein